MNSAWTALRCGLAVALTVVASACAAAPAATSATAATVAASPATTLPRAAAPNALRAESGTIRAASAGQAETWAFITLVNDGQADAVVSATSPDAEQVVLRAVRVADAGRLTRSVAAIPVPAHGRLVMSAGDWLLAFIKTRRAFAAGDTTHATLRFASGAELTVTLSVVEAGDN